MDSKLGKGYDVFFARDTVSLTLDAPRPTSVSAHLLRITNNPATSHAVVSSDEELCSFAATDLLGRSIPLAFSNGVSGYDLDLQLLSAGAYIVSARTSKGMILTAKLTVLR